MSPSNRPPRGRRRRGQPGRPGRPWQTEGQTDGESAVPPSPRSQAEFVVDPITGQMAEMRRLQPYEARKEYICPGCNQEIRPGTRHLVIVPLTASDMRRHWHEPCFARAKRHGYR